jgi:uncharacterized protein (TIGR02466 family)
MITIESIFPTPILIDTLEREVTTEEKEFVKNTAKSVRGNINNSISVSNSVLENQSLKNIKKFIDKNLNLYKENILSTKNNIELYVTESWINYTNKNQSHHRHQHDNSIISGVFYFNTLDTDNISFYKNKNGLSLSFDVKNSNTFNSLSYKLPVKTGTLILFPSDLQHEVDENIEEKTRISLSFNTFVRGIISEVPTIKLTIF